MELIQKKIKSYALIEITFEDGILIIILILKCNMHFSINIIQIERMIKMSEELMRVLKMVESGVITSEEGEKLIQAMQKSEQKVARVNSVGRFLRVDILSTEEGEKETVQINFPLNLAKVVLKMGVVQKQLNAKVGEDVNLDIEEILALIDSGVMGDLMTIDTKDAKIRIWID